MAFQRVQNGHANGKSDSFGANGELPMYKDKPYGYPGSTRKSKSALDRWRIPGGILLGFLLVMYYIGAFSPKDTHTSTKSGSWSWLGAGRRVDWEHRREDVRQAFIESWDAYEKYAWGYDMYHPLSKNGEQMSRAGKGMGWIIVDALDTLMIMNLTSRLSHAREWVATSLDYDQDIEVNTFETTIRMLGGLLSAHYLSSELPHLAPLSDAEKGTVAEDLYLEKATDLASRMMGAFDSDSGVPYASVNLKTSKGIESHADGGASSTAEATSLQLEYKYLAYLTGEKNYWEKVEKVMEVVDDNGMEDGLLPIFIYANTGHFRGEIVRLGSRGDSYYEYLLKQFLQTEGEEPIYQEMWNQSLAGVRKHMITYSSPSNFTVLAELPAGVGNHISAKMDHLVCFMPGTIALGTTGGIPIAEAKRAGRWGAKEESELQLAIELTKTCYGMYKVMATGLAPEIAFFNVAEPPHMEKDGPLASAALSDDPAAAWREDYVIKHNDNHNLQRPETVETLFYMWRLTGDVKYREWGWDIFQSYLKYTRADGDGGYTSLAHANELPPILKDNMESFWLAETLKYLYLLFSPNDLLPLDQVVFNTEAHVFPRFKLARGLSTGWRRKLRDYDGHIVETPASHGGGGGAKKVVKTESSIEQDTSPPALATAHGVIAGSTGLS